MREGFLEIIRLSIEILSTLEKLIKTIQNDKIWILFLKKRWQNTKKRT